MLFWLITGTITLAVAAILAGALRASGRRDAFSPAASDKAVYRDQLAEIDRDVARGVLTEAEAETVRIEVSRRLLDADKRETGADDTRAGAPMAGIAISTAILILGGTGLYLTIGAPGYSDQPLGDRLAAAEDARASRPSQDAAEVAARAVLPAPVEIPAEYAELMTRLRAAVAERSDDLQGLQLLAQNEARIGNYSAARQAQERLVDVQGGDAPLESRIALLDIMVFAAGGVVTPEAEARLSQIEAIAPEAPEARYYRGLLAAQTGRPDLAFPIWRRLLETSPPDAPWVPVIRSEIRAVAAAAGVDYVPPPLRGPSAEDMAAAADMSAEDRAEMVRGMVSRLSERLATDGGPPADWAQLIRALGVLGQAERAAQIGEEAETAFADNPEALALIQRAVREAVEAASTAGQ